MSSLAVFIALGGTAVALKANSVGSRQIKNDSVKGRDIGNGKIKGKDLAEGAIGSREVRETELALGSIIGIESSTGGCDPTSTQFIVCASVQITSRTPARALLVAGGGQRGSAGARGDCKFLVNSQDDPLSFPPSSFGDAAERTPGDDNGLSLTAVSDNLNLIPAGTNDFALACNQTAGDVAFVTTLSVLALGGAVG